MSQSYSTIINALNQFGTNHLSVKRFKTSFFEQFDPFSSNDNTFPILYAVPNDVGMDEFIDRYSFRVYCVDILQKDRSNEAAILNDTLWVLRDLRNWLNISDNNLNILNNPRAIPVNNFLVDFTVGWYLDIEIEANAESNDCSIPFSPNFQFSGYTCDIFYVQQYLTCETLQDCASFIALENRVTILEQEIADITGSTTNTYVTGGTFNQVTETLTLSRNDNQNVIITGFTSPFDVFVTGATFDNTTNVAEFTNNTGGTFTVTINTDLGGYVPYIGATANVQLDKRELIVNSVSNSFGLEVNQFTDNTPRVNIGISVDDNGLINVYDKTNTLATIIEGGQIISNAYVVNGGTADQILLANGTLGSFPTDVYVTGGTYTNGTAIFTNNTGGTFNVSGFVTGDTFVTGYTYNNANTFNIKRNQGQPDLTASINIVTGLTTNYFDFNTGATVTRQTARMTWNDTDGTLDLGLKGGNVTLQIGQEQVVRVVNKTGSNLTEAGYQAVRISGAQGNRIKVDLAQANNDANSAETIGLVTENIDNNQEGFITTMGLVRGINTTGSLQGETWLDGDMLYLSPTTAGRITNIKPVAPQHTVIIGYVVQSNPSTGSIFVKVDNGYELGELHNVNVTGATNGQVLTYSASTGLWVPTTPSSSSGGTGVDTYVTGFTYSPNTLTIKRNQGQPDLSVAITTMSALTITSGLTANTLNLSTTPTLNNSVTQLLGRNSTTGNVEYANASSYLNSASVTQIYGNGIDGAYVFDGTNTYSGVTTKVGNVYTLIRTLYATNITVASGVTVDTNGFAVYANGTLLNSGTISANGNNGANGITSGPVTAGGVTRDPGVSNYKITRTGAAGGAGGNPSSNGGSITVATNYIGGIGGSGGQGKPVGNTGTTTFVRGTVGVTGGILQQPYSSNYLGHSLYAGTNQMYTSWGGAGGGVGINAGGSNPGYGGGGGSTGFIVPIFANTLTMSGTSSLIQSNGGNGGNGGTSSGGNGTGGGGGGAGGGGYVYIVSSTLNYTPNNQIQAKGGTGGTGGLGTGTVAGQNVAGVASESGSNGVDGTVVIINPTAGTNVGYTGQI